MRVLIIGGTGLIGKAVTERLRQKNWNIRILDLSPGITVEGAEYVQGDILNAADLLEAIRGCDTVLHLAAIRSPSLAPGQEIFRVNATGTFNVFEAAAAVGIKRVVQASSINALGGFYSTGEIHPQYFPIDEAHPSFTTDPYSFSKQIVEDIGAYYWRRDAVSGVSLRFPGVYPAGYTTHERYLQRQEKAHQLLDDLASQPEAQTQAMIEDVKKRVLQFRQERKFEYRPDSPDFPSGLFDDPLFGMYIADRFNFWTAIDERDAAQSLEKALTADYQGHHVLFVNDSHNWLDYDSRTLLRLFFPEVNDLRSDLTGSTALVSIDRARELIGFEPEFSVHNLDPVPQESRP